MCKSNIRLLLSPTVPGSLSTSSSSPQHIPQPGYLGERLREALIKFKPSVAKAFTMKLYSLYIAATAIFLGTNTVMADCKWFPDGQTCQQPYITICDGQGTRNLYCCTLEGCPPSD